MSISSSDDQLDGISDVGESSDYFDSEGQLPSLRDLPSLTSDSGSDDPSDADEDDERSSASKKSDKPKSFDNPPPKCENYKRPIEIIPLSTLPKSLSELGLMVIDPLARGVVDRLKYPMEVSSAPLQTAPIKDLTSPLKYHSHLQYPTNSPSLDQHPIKTEKVESMGELPISSNRTSIRSYFTLSNTSNLRKEMSVVSANVPQSRVSSTSTSHVPSAPKVDQNCPQLVKKSSTGDVSLARSKFISNLRAILISSPCSLSATDLNADYKAMVGENIPFKELGHLNLSSLLRSLDDVISIYETENALFVSAKVSSDSVHVSSLVQNQKKGTSKKDGRRLRNSQAMPQLHEQVHKAFKGRNDNRGQPVKSEHESDNIVNKNKINDPPASKNGSTNRCGNRNCISVDLCSQARQNYERNLESHSHQWAASLRQAPPQQFSLAVSLISDIINASQANALCNSTCLSGLVTRQPGGKIVFKTGPRASANSHLSNHRRCCCECSATN